LKIKKFAAAFGAPLPNPHWIDSILAEPLLGPHKILHKSTRLIPMHAIQIRA